jgi:hypothetical protein
MSAAKSKPQTGASSVSKSTSVATTAKPSKFYFACRNNEIDVVTALLPTLTLNEINQIEPNGSTALHAAAYYGNQEIVHLLLSKGAQRMIKNLHGSTPYDEAKTEHIKKLFRRPDGGKTESGSRFTGEKGPSFEWIFIKGDPSSYASFNRKSLWKCESDEEFNRLCRGIQQHYINENGPLAEVKHIELVRLFIDEAIENNDPKEIVRAYTAETGFYRRLNSDLSQMPTHWSGTKHERNIASIMIFHPVFQGFSFTGETYRGMSMSLKDLNEYIVDSVFMNKTFLSTSKERSRAELFAATDGSSPVFGVVCKYSIKHTGTALAIEDISEFSFEKEVLILPYAVFKVKRIRKSTGKTDVITEIDVEEAEEEEVQWTLKKSYHTSHTDTSVKKKISGNHDDDDDDSYAKMFKDSQEKGKIDPADLAKWKQQSFGINSETDTYGKMWNDAKKGKFNKSDLANWKKENGLLNHEDSDLESYDDENNSNIFTASNHQSYATSKKFTSKDPFDMKDFMAEFENDSDE